MPAQQAGDLPPLGRIGSGWMSAALGQRLGEMQAPDTGCTLCDLDECLKLFVSRVPAPARRA